MIGRWLQFDLAPRAPYRTGRPSRAAWLHVSPALADSKPSQNQLRRVAVDIVVDPGISVLRLTRGPNTIEGLLELPPTLPTDQSHEVIGRTLVLSTCRRGINSHRGAADKTAQNVYM